MGMAYNPRPNPYAATLALILDIVADRGIRPPDRFSGESVALWDREGVNAPVILRAHGPTAGTWGELDPYWLEADGGANHLFTPARYSDLEALCEHLGALLALGAERPPAALLGQMSGRLDGLRVNGL